MTTYSHETARTQLVQANGIGFAYRRFGRIGGTPLVFLQYFAGNLDNWDPAITNGFAGDREIILFDNAGVGSSGGETPPSVPEMTRDLVAFLQALHLEQVDILGFSLGGMIAQQLTLDYPRLVKRLLLIGTGPRGGEGMTFTDLSVDEAVAHPEQLLLGAFFAPTDSSQAAGQAFLRRLINRREDRDSVVSIKSLEAQLNAIKGWGRVPPSERYASLSKIRHKTLVVHGNHDQVVLPINSLILAQHIPNAQLIVYPDSAHGAHYQHNELFLKHARLFLSSTRATRDSLTTSRPYLPRGRLSITVKSLDTVALRRSGQDHRGRHHVGNEIRISRVVDFRDRRVRFCFAKRNCG